MIDVLGSQRPDVSVRWLDDPGSVPGGNDSIAGAPAHVVQFYEADPFLLDSVRDFVGTGLDLGHAAIVIATRAHRVGLEERLEADGLDLVAASARGQYIALDAAETLSKLMVDGMPEPSRFVEVIGDTVAGAAGQYSHVHAFGEMVALLAAAGNHAGAIRLEQLWNALQTTHAFSLLCAYPMGILGGEALAQLVGDVCAEHAHVVPTESYTALTNSDERLRAITRLQQKAQSLQAEIVERKRAESALQSLFRISQKLHASLDLETLLDQLVVESLQLVGAEGGLAGLRTPDGLVCQKYLRRSESVPLEYCWPLGHGLPGWLLEHKAPYLTNDALRDGQMVRKLGLQFGVRSALSTPILDAHGEVLGFFELHNRTDGSDFTSADQEKLVAVSQVASVAIQNARLYREARDAVRQRDEFLAIASHELRTPLTTVRAHAQLMLRRLSRDGVADSVAIERAFGAISQQTGKLTRLVEQLLDVSRLDTGGLTLARQVTDLGELIEQVVNAAAMQTHKSIEVRTPAGIRSWVDPLRLDQLLTNLLDNAIKYGSDAAAIQVELTTCSDGQVQIAVRDHGDGIPEEKRGRLFERFFQAHAEGYMSGMGLGLYLSRQIAELHGGQIDAQFPLDGGTRFVVRLPLVPDEPLAPVNGTASR
jgi:signal transduction histidine kinase